MSFYGQLLRYEDEADWLEQRRAGIGASDVAGIVGLSPYATPFTVWSDKVHGAEDEPSFAMTFGKRVEGLILEYFEEATGLHTAGRQLLIQHPRFEWIRCTVDALVFESPDTAGDDELLRAELEAALGTVEAKSDGSFKRWDEIPDHHMIQVQWQLLATGLDHAWLAVLHGRRFEKYEIAADETVQNKLFERVKEFRADHILTGEPPEPDGEKATSRVIARLWPETTPDKTIELSRQMAADVERLKGLKSSRSVLNEQIKELENRVKVSMQDAELGLVDGKPALTLRTIERDGYTVEPGSYRRLDLK